MSTGIGSLAVQIVGTTTGLSASLKQAGMQLKSFKADVDKDGGLKSLTISGGIDKEAGGIKTAFAGIGTFIASQLLSGIRSGLDGMRDLVHESIKLGAELEDSLVKFEVLLGSEEKAKQLVSDIRVFAKQTPLNSREMNDAAGLLLTNGVEQDQIIPTISMLGDIATASNSPLKEMGMLYSQVRSKGKVYAEETMHFSERGIGLNKLLAESLGKTTAEVIQLTADGKISFSMFQKALRDSTSEGGRFFGMMNKRGQTFNGLKSTLTDTFQNAASEFGTILIEELDLKGLLKELTSGFEQATGDKSGLRTFVKEFKPIVWEFAKVSVDFLHAAKWLMEFVTPALKFTSDLMIAIDRFGDYVYEFTFSVDKQKGELSTTGRGDFAGGNNFGDFFDPADMEYFGQELGKGRKALEIEAEKLSADDMKRVQSIRDAYNPIGEMTRKIADLQRLKDLGGFAERPDMFNFAIADTVKPFLKDYTDATQRMAPNAERGGVEAASILAAASTDSARDIGQETVNAINELKRINEKQLETARMVADAIKNAQLLGVR